MVLISYSFAVLRYAMKCFQLEERVPGVPWQTIVGRWWQGETVEKLCISNIDSIVKPCLLVFVFQMLIPLSHANCKKYVFNYVLTKNTWAAFNEFSQCWCRYHSTCSFCSRSMHLFYLKRSGDRGMGSSKMAFLATEGVGIELDHFCENHTRAHIVFTSKNSSQQKNLWKHL